MIIVLKHLIMDKKIKKTFSKVKRPFTYKGKFYKVGSKIRINESEKRTLINKFLI